MSIISIGQAIHNLFRVIYSNHPTWDETFEYAFIFERSIACFCFLHILAGLSWLVGAIAFYKLKVATRESKYSSKTLSESYQLREISKTVQVLGPLMLAYMTFLIFCWACLGVLYYQYYFNDCHVESTLYLGIVNVRFTGGVTGYRQGLMTSQIEF